MQSITNGLLDSVRPGVVGVPATSVVSLDEKTLKLKFKGPLALLGAQELDKLRFKPKGAPVRIWSLGT